jgi:transcriptional regulator
MTNMYLPKQFEQTDPAQLIALMREQPLATLILVSDDGAPTADLIPLEFAPDEGEHGVLRGHVARANPLWRRAGREALAVFTGPEAYVSPGWYASKREHGKVVPTWNYTMVQARGLLSTVEDAPWLHELVSRLTNQHEAGRAAPWRVTDAPNAYVDQMLRAIVGIEIALTSLAGKWKVSQNRSAADRDGVVHGLVDSAQPEMAALVAKPAGTA